MDSAARTRALIAEGPLLTVQAQYTRSRAVLHEALALAERRQAAIALAEASMYLGNVTVLAGSVEEGTTRLQEAVRRWEALGNPHGLGETLFVLGYAADVAGETAPAAAAHYTVLLWASWGKAGNARHAGFVHSYLGVLEWRSGQLSSAVAHLQAALRTSVTLRDRWLLSFAAQATVVLVNGARPARRVGTPVRGSGRPGRLGHWRYEVRVGACARGTEYGGIARAACARGGVECGVSRGSGRCRSPEKRPWP